MAEGRDSLWEAQERFRRTFEDARVGMALVDLEGRFLDVNDALCSATGYPRAELLGGALTALLHPEERPRAGERRVLHADGHAVWMELVCSDLHDAAGEPARRIVQFVDLSERRRFEGQLRFLADHDPLTGLFNRHRFEEELDREVVAATRYGSRGAVLALGLDDFKYVNDALGHPVGDRLIVQVAGLLKARMRESDTLARLGGDQFALILPHVGRAQALAVAEQLRGVIAHQAGVPGHKPLPVRASVGVALYRHRPRKLSSETLLVEAEIAMYDAKAAGRDRVVVYDGSSDGHERMQSRITWVERIRRALAEDRFTLRAQPIVALGDDTTERHELLVRMIGDSGELIPPSAFLHVAEQSALIQEIDRWVVERAIRLLAEHQSAGRDLCLEVNLSGKSVTDPRLPHVIGEALARTGADPRGLVFEVTETTAIVNVDRAKLFAQELNALGCRFALDDFGAGFASFYYLKHLAFDYLKIDGEFIRDLAASRTNQLVVQSLVAIARGLGKKTIAECVEDEATWRLLGRYGVDYAQGFLLGAPAPLDALGDRSGAHPE